VDNVEPFLLEPTETWGTVTSVQMKLVHHDLEVELPDEWWAEAGMLGFVAASSTYPTDAGLCKGQEIRAIFIEDIAPVQRAEGVGIFNDSVEDGSAKDRVLHILRGFRQGVPIPPVEIVEGGSLSNHRYKLVHGYHRLYCSLAAGFTHVPTIEGFDPDR
jgi:hypothetical protein